MSPKAKPVFERRIFWDVDFDSIDYEAKYRFVIEREKGYTEKVKEYLR